MECFVAGTNTCAITIHEASKRATKMLCVLIVAFFFKKFDLRVRGMALLTAYFACGCFWGAQYYFSKLEGVSSTSVGYMGGTVDNPTYRRVKRGDTGHFETTEVTYDTTVTTYENLVHFFFEIHDFSQDDGQGPDIGSQYLSAVFTADDHEREIVDRSIAYLREKRYEVATKILPLTTFWKADEYHQNYYDKDDSEASPYCHSYHPIFGV
jgi:methionine-S-sulfoxide reductase